MHNYYWQNIEKKRYYHITILDTREGYNAYLNWGSLVTQRRYKKIMTFDSNEALQTYVTYISKRRNRRGYKLLATPTLNYRALRAPTNPKAPMVLTLNEARATR